MLLEIALLPIGGLMFSLAEYAVHRYVLHDALPEGHRDHHAHPDDYSVGWMVPLAAFAVAGIVAGVWSIGFAAGVLIGWAWYAYLHYRFHHHPFERGSLLHPLQRHHERHHKLARYNFGVSTTLWDRVFGTRL
jgi:sterol desaturase/sphingolipid hydroxylase (fatty acid hydroxylase superfamily)